MLKYTRIKPAPGRLVIDPVEKQRMTAGGLYIPDTAVNMEHSSQIGTVLWINETKVNWPGGEEDPFDVPSPHYKVGDVVVFGKWSGAEVTFDGRTVYLLPESAILGTLVAEEQDGNPD